MKKQIYQLDFNDIYTLLTSHLVCAAFFDSTTSSA